MKVVFQHLQLQLIEGEYKWVYVTKTKWIQEYELGYWIDYIRSNWIGDEQSPKKSELFRFKLFKGVIIIYKDNRILRTRNEWYEHRALTALAREMHCQFHQGVFFRKNGYQTEVDGVPFEGDFLVEIKRTKINQKWVDFYAQKLWRLNSLFEKKYRQIYLVGHDFEEALDIRNKPVILTKFSPDWRGVDEFYKTFKFPTWIRDKIPPRHFKFLLPNGFWKGIKRKLSATTKHTLESKFFQSIDWLRHWTPVKIYYSMSRMVNPARDYHGKGHPLPHILAVFDIDADEHSHVVSSVGFCEECIEGATKKRVLVEEKLHDEGHLTKTVFSGKKGIHLYIMEGDSAKEVSPSEILELVKSLGDLTDSSSFRDKSKNFDAHRIIKVPNTIDASTGMIVNEKIQKLNLNDTIIFL